jgi:hypothetical protein
MQSEMVNPEELLEAAVASLARQAHSLPSHVHVLVEQHVDLFRAHAGTTRGQSRPFLVMGVVDG